MARTLKDQNLWKLWVIVAANSVFLRRGEFRRYGHDATAARPHCIRHHDVIGAAAIMQPDAVTGAQPGLPQGRADGADGVV